MVFVKNKRIILSRDKLIDLVQGIDYDGDYILYTKKYETTANENGNVLIKIKNIDYKNVRLKKCNSICNYILVI